MTQEILIGEVEIISMLMAPSPRVSKTLAATPGCERMPAPTIETLPISASSAMRSNSEPACGAERVARRAQVVARDGERDVGAGALGLGLVLDDHVDVDVGGGQRAEDPAGHAGRVGDADAG